MRTVFRLLFLIILLAGLGLAILYPWAVTSFSGYEYARIPLYERGTGFKPATVRLSPQDGPIRVIVEMSSVGAANLSGDTTILSLAVTADGATVLSAPLTFRHQDPRPDAPQMGGDIYQDVAGVIAEPRNADYVFSLAPGAAGAIEMRTVTLELRAGAMEFDARLAPVGYMLLAVGFIGLVLSLRRRSVKPSEPQPPPQPKWGRQ